MKKFADSHIHYRFLKFDEIENMLDLMHSIGVTDACMLALPYRGAAENLTALYWKMTYKKMTMRAFGGLHITDRYCQIPPEVMVENILKLGFDGIKIMNSPNLRKFVNTKICDEKYHKMYAFLEEKGVPVNMHVNDPRTFWENGNYDITIPSYDEIYAEAIEMLDKFPNLNIVFAHFFFLSDNPKEAERIMETYPNVRFDLTPGVEMYRNFPKDIEYWREFFTKYRKRILFGTDSNSIKKCNKSLNGLVLNFLTHSHDEFVQPDVYGKDFHLRGLALDEDVVEDICYNNYIDFVGEVKPVNKEIFYKCCERVLNDIKNNLRDEYYIAGGELIADLKADPEQKISTDFIERVLSEK